MTAGNPSERGKDGKFQCAQNGHIGRTEDIVAKEHGIGKNTVRRAAKFSKGVDAAEKIESGARKDTITDEDKVIQVKGKNVLCN